MEKWETYTKEELEDFVKTSQNTTELSLKIGYKARNSGAIKRLLEKYNFDVSHWIKHENLSGQTFGSLYVIEKEEEMSKQKKYSIYKCKCSCGKICYKRANSLKTGHIKHCSSACPILKEEHINTIDLTGQVFNELTVLKFKGITSSRRALWECKCSCGRKIFVEGTILINNRIKSCGCIQASYNVKLIKKILDNSKSFQEKYYYKTEIKFEDLKGKSSYLRFDFGIYDKNNHDLKKIIEYQGEQHFRIIKTWGGEEKFKERQLYDSLKREYCIKNNIYLQEISYKENITEKLLMKKL